MKARLPRVKCRGEFQKSNFQTKFVLAVAGAFIALTAAVSAQTADPKDGVIYLDQGWSQADRETYYQIAQGSEAFAYDIYLNLEVAGSQELFRSDANSERYGLIPQAANPQTNPDGLPIGVTKTGSPKVDGRARTLA